MKNSKLTLICALLLVLLLVSCESEESVVTVVTTPAFNSSQTSITTIFEVIKTTPLASTTAVEKTTKPSVAAGTTISAESSLPDSTKQLGTGGDVAFAYPNKFAMVNSCYVPKELTEQFIVWTDALTNSKSLNRARGSLYDYIRQFNITETYFREANTSVLEPYNENEIIDLFYLTKEEFNQKYAEPYFIVKGEDMYYAFELMKLTDEELATTGVTREEVSAEIDKFYLEDPEMAEWYRQKYGY